MASVRAQPWAALEADNLTSLAELTEANLLKAIDERYRAGLIYTAVGDILVAVNPFEELHVYDATWSGAYAATDVSGLAPHIYRVASAAYNSMVQGKKNQVCVISGESGAGKTESAKFIMRQVSVGKERRCGRDIHWLLWRCYTLTPEGIISMVILLLILLCSLSTLTANYRYDTSNLCTNDKGH